MDHFGLHLAVGQGGLAAAFGLAEDQPRLAAGTGPGHHDSRQVRAQGDGLAQPDGRSAHGNQHIRADVARMGRGLLRDGDGRVHYGAGEAAGPQRPQIPGELIRHRGLMRGCQDQGARRAERLDLLGDLPADAGSKTHADGGGRGGEFLLETGHMASRPPLLKTQLPRDPDFADRMTRRRFAFVL